MNRSELEQLCLFQPLTAATRLEELGRHAANLERENDALREAQQRLAGMGPKEAPTRTTQAHIERATYLDGVGRDAGTVNLMIE